MARKSKKICSFRRCQKPRLAGTMWCEEHYRVKQYESEITTSKVVMVELFEIINNLRKWNVKSADYMDDLVMWLKSTGIDPQDNRWMLLFEAERWASSLELDAEEAYDECRELIYADTGG